MEVQHGMRVLIVVNVEAVVGDVMATVGGGFTGPGPVALHVVLAIPEQPHANGMGV